MKLSAGPSVSFGSGVASTSASAGAEGAAVEGPAAAGGTAAASLGLSASIGTSTNFRALNSLNEINKKKLLFKMASSAWHSFLEPCDALKDRAKRNLAVGLVKMLRQRRTHHLLAPSLTG